MNCPIKNPANHDLSDLEPHVHGMYDHFASKYGFDKHPTMVFDSDEENKAEILGKTAYYDPQNLEIHVFVDGRHSKDILRSIAHELIHHKQNLEGRLDVGGYSGPGYYLENDKLKEVEHEAMLEGNATMREYEDTVKYTETKNMSLKEWKNNELNQLLMKKFGILKEEKDVKMVPKSEVPDGAEVVVPDGPGDLVGIKKEEIEEAHCMGKRDEELEEVSSNAQQSDRRQDGEDATREYGRLREEEQLEEGEVEETVRRVDSQNYPGNRAGQGTPEQDRKNMREEQIEEDQLNEFDYYAAQKSAKEMLDREEEILTKLKATGDEEKIHAQRLKLEKLYQDVANQGFYMEESVQQQPSRAQELKEAITKIANAKRIFLNNKRIK
jgi:hypothetical protein